MATWNRDNFIPEALDSIIAQTFKDWECLVIDDGCTDNTKRIVNSYLKRDERIKYYTRTSAYKKGLPGSRNYGMNLAKGEYIIFFDDDDIVHPENLNICVEQMERNKDSFFCRYDKEAFWGNLNIDKFPLISPPAVKKVSEKGIEKMITGELPFASCTVLWKKTCFKENRFNENLMYAEEWELYSRILIAGFEGISINSILYYNRKHEKSNTGEFFNNDPIRRESKIKAVEEVIKNLKKNDLLSPAIIKYFLQLGFFLKSRVIIKLILLASDAPVMKKLIYSFGFMAYPILRPIFVLKGKFLKNEKRA